MPAVNPYLNFNGNTEEAFLFYKSVFGGEFIMLQRFKDVLEADKLNDVDRDKIMHISLPIGRDTVLMATDALESMGQIVNFGNNFFISISTASEAEAEKLFYGLSNGGNVIMQLEKSFWGAYFGMFADRFGVQWMINYNYEL